jgi:hypothetical protein
MSETRCHEINGGRKCEGIVCVWCELENTINWWEQNTLGKILTVLDASIADKQQNKAIKDLIKQAYRVGQGNCREDVMILVDLRLKGELKEAECSPRTHLSPNPISEVIDCSEGSV